MRPQIQLAGRIVALLALATAMPQAAAEVFDDTNSVGIAGTDFKSSGTDLFEF